MTRAPRARRRPSIRTRHPRPRRPGSPTTVKPIAMQSGESGGEVSKKARRPKVVMEREAEPAEAPEPRAGSPSALELGVGGMALFRQLVWTSDARAAGLGPYSLTPGPEAGVWLEFYPGAFATEGFAANIGLIARYDYGFGVTSYTPGGGDVGTKYQDFLAGLKVRIPLGTFTPNFSVAYGEQGFQLTAQGTPQDLPGDGLFLRPHRGRDAGAVHPGGRARRDRRVPGRHQFGDRAGAGGLHRLLPQDPGLCRRRREPRWRSASPARSACGRASTSGSTVSPSTPIPARGPWPAPSTATSWPSPASRSCWTGRGTSHPRRAAGRTARRAARPRRRKRNAAGRRRRARQGSRPGDDES